MRFAVDNRTQRHMRAFVLPVLMALVLTISVALVSGCDRVSRTPPPSTPAVPTTIENGSTQDGSGGPAAGTPEWETHPTGANPIVPGPTEVPPPGVPGPTEAPLPTPLPGPAEAPLPTPQEQTTTEPALPMPSVPETGAENTATP